MAASNPLLEGVNTTSTGQNASETNWSLCIICQESRNEKLICPGESKRPDSGVGYKTLVDDLNSFCRIGKLPHTLKLSRLDDGSGVCTTLINHMAKWHKTCRDSYNRTKLLRLEKKRPIVDSEPSASTCSAPKQRRSLTPTVMGEYKCFFCDEPGDPGELHHASTFGLDSRVRSAALKLGDTKLLAKLSAGDVVAIEMKYHLKCLTSLYNHAKLVENKESLESKHNNMIHSIAFAELVVFVEEELGESDTPILKLADLVKMYRNRLFQLGIHEGTVVHTTRLKERLLAHIPGLQAHTKGNRILLVRDKDVGKILSKVYEKSDDSDAICLARAAQIVRRDIFDPLFTFEGSFESNCQENSVPTTLITLINMLLEGPNIVKQIERQARSEALTIAQLIRYNSVKGQRRKSSTALYHHQTQDTPLPLYVGMMLYAQTRKRGLIDKMFELGISVSYDRILQLSTDLSNAVCKQYEESQVVVPVNFRKGVYTASAVDNVDHNSSSNTATCSYHGTSISLTQHPDFDGQGTVVSNISLSTSLKYIRALPDFYTYVPPVVTPSKDPSLPPPVVSAMAPQGDKQGMDSCIQEEYAWLQTVSKAVNGELDTTQFISWSAYHASNQSSDVCPKGSTALLPLFEDSAHSIAMIRHSMTITMAAIHHLNPGQIPVLACDQPLYALAKTIQWTWPHTFGEDKLLMMFGGLHIEMAAWSAVGAWIDGSGWTDVLTEADVATAGKAESYIHCSHLMRTRHAHAITAASLYILQQQAYSEYENEVEDDHERMTFETWCQEKAKNHPQFKYWCLVLELELYVLIFVRSLRSSNFKMYVEALVQLMPWFFALNRVNYSRWLSVHVRDMQQLPITHPELAKEFEAGKFTITKTGHAFSAMPLDQCHEQNNKMVKEDGGAIGLFDNPQALRRWMIGGPQIARIGNEFEEALHSTMPEQSTHHEQVPSFQIKFKTHVQSMVDKITEYGNPFLDNSRELVSLSTKDVADPSVVTTVNEIVNIGSQQYKTFVKERLVDRSKSINDTIPKNKLTMMKDRPKPAVLSKSKLQLKSAKKDCQLFSRLYIGCQNRGSDVNEFFTHENQACPPSISDGGKLRHGSKSDLLQCFEKLHEAREDVPEVSAMIVDGAAVVQMLKPGTAKTFQEYSDSVFVPFIARWLQRVSRVDVIWDVYLSSSLKSSTREKRGKGKRRRVTPSTPLPRNWQEFLRVDENKTELFHFLSHQVVQIEADGKELLATDGQEVLCSPSQENLSQLSPCSHEEADTRIFVHCAHAVSRGHRCITIRTVDTDVVVLAIGSYFLLGIDELWIAFGTGNKFRYLAIHQYAQSIGPARARALPMFHSFTGCDTVSFFAGRGKKTAWDVWISNEQVTAVFQQLTDFPNEILDDQLALIERFVVLLYERTSGLVKVNDARKHLFTKKNRSVEGIPPSYAALLQHTKRAVYQGGHIWGQCTIPRPTLPDPTSWGWMLEGTTYRPFWTTLPDATKSCQELVRCGCKKGCFARCNCVKSALQCTALCACDGQCVRDSTA